MATSFYVRAISTHKSATAVMASTNDSPKLKPHKSSRKNVAKNTHAFLSVLLLTHLRLNLTVHGLNCNFILIFSYIIIRS